jgi:ABC-type sugar transport system substrate-binding protein
MANRFSVVMAMAISALALTGPSTVRADKKITLGFSQIGAESEWRTANTK